ncbi:hypothetical protein FHT86_007124 [Rhizobium sp. BK313]|nr:hypothetical protein [Rhizobium sp. BK313]
MAAPQIHNQTTNIVGRDQRHRAMSAFDPGCCVRACGLFGVQPATVIFCSVRSRDVPSD